MLAVARQWRLRLEGEFLPGWLFGNMGAKRNEGVGRRVEREYGKFRPLSAAREIVIALVEPQGANQDLIVNAQITPGKTLAILKLLRKKGSDRIDIQKVRIP